MRAPGLHNSYAKLGIVFLVLVLLPSFLLGYFSLRAVEDERQEARGRILEDAKRFAEFAGRAVHHDLVDLEAAWQAIVRKRVGWEERAPEIVLALEQARGGEAFVHGAYLMRVSGDLLYPPPAAGAAPAEEAARRAAGLAAPPPAESQLFADLVAQGEAAEFESGGAARAEAAYRDILRRVRTPRLLAVARSGLGRVYLQQGDWERAIAEYRRVLDAYPEALDLDNQPLRFLAKLQIARALEGKGEKVPAARALLDLYEDLAQHSDEINTSQYDFFVERIAAQMAHLTAGGAPVELQALLPRYRELHEGAKKRVGDAFFVAKLARKLARAVMDEVPYSPEVRYVSDVADGVPFLLAYIFLPDRSETSVTGLVGFEIDLPRLSRALLPQTLRELELSEDVGLGVVDDDGHLVIGDAAAARSPQAVQSNLGEPFEFWNVAVYHRAPERAARNAEFRTKVFLYFILLLLVTIVAGAIVVALGMRRESRLANLKTSLVSNVSHELRTPLTSIRLYAEMLEMAAAGSSETERRRHLATIRRECDRLERLIDAVLGYARMERGAKTYSFEFEEIGPLVRSVAEDFRGQAQAENFRYAVEIDVDLPEVRVDADALRQVLLNLLSNAVKYSDSERSIAVRAFRRGDEVGLQVEDHGVGIDPAEHERIFEDFYRVDQRLSSPRQGVGLGLTLVRHIVAAHGGRVEVESARGCGARFTVWLPVERTESPGTAGGGQVTAEA